MWLNRFFVSVPLTVIALSLSLGCGQGQPLALINAPPSLARHTVFVERPEVYAVTKKGNERVEENVPEDAAFRAKLVEMLETALVSAGYHIAIDTNVKHEITLRTEWFGWKTDISRFWEHCAGVAKFNFSLPLKQSALVQISEACPWNLDEVAKLVVNQLTSSPRFRQVATTNESVQNPPSPAAISQSTTPTPDSTNPSLDRRGQ